MNVTQEYQSVPLLSFPQSHFQTEPKCDCFVMVTTYSSTFNMNEN